MGWLEVLAMLKRLLPLLTKVAPMLETFVAARAGASTRDEAALQRMAADLQAGLRADLVGIAAAHRTATDEALAQHTTELRQLRAEIKQQREEQAAQALQAQQQLAAAQATLRAFFLATLSLAVVCVTLLVVLLVRH